MVITCFHCGLPASADYSADIAGDTKMFCCVGCREVALAICAGGLSDFYRLRDTNSRKAEIEAERYSIYNDPHLQDDFVESLDESTSRATLHLHGITCAACAWLIENYLGALPGTQKIKVNVSNAQCSLEWNKNKTALSHYFSSLAKIGFKAEPLLGAQAQETRRRVASLALMRLGVAGLAMMQVGVSSVALHAGTLQGIDAHMQHFLRWVSLLFALPLIFFSAVPFFQSAWRALRLKHLNMDVPVSLALVLAFAASVYATLTNQGEVYFDSLAMFIFFLLLGRYFEMRARHSRALGGEQRENFLPLAVRVMDATGTWQWQVLKSVQNGQTLRVEAGEIIPCDGFLLGEHASVDEALVSGESQLQSRKKGDALLAGSLLGDTSIVMRVSANGTKTRLAAIEALVREAALQKPRQQEWADRLASHFVFRVLILSLAVFAFWLWYDSSRAFWIALSVLVVSCPCALSLAIPTALTAGVNRLRTQGFLIRAAHVLEVLPDIRQLVSDKTGTLTNGKIQLAETRCIDGGEAANYLEIIAALEAHSQHPLAKAFQAFPHRRQAQKVRVFPGQGVSGEVEGIQYQFGSAAFAGCEELEYPGTGYWLLLASAQRALMWCRLEDEAREGLEDFFQNMHAAQFNISILSGDRQANVDAFVERFKLLRWISRAVGGASPEDKLAYVKSLQAQDKVLMIGDGINDAPVLQQADLSIAMVEASQLARNHADALLLNGNLQTIVSARQLAIRVKRVIRQNIAWAFTYNILALPLAACGLVPPWLAAIGMSASSLVVVLNAMRITRFK